MGHVYVNEKVLYMIHTNIIQCNIRQWTKLLEIIFNDSEDFGIFWGLQILLTSITLAVQENKNFQFTENYTNHILLQWVTLEKSATKSCLPKEI